MFQTLYQRHPRLLAEILDMKTMMVGCAAGEAHLDGGNDAARADFRDLCARDQDRDLCPRPKKPASSFYPKRQEPKSDAIEPPRWNFSYAHALAEEAIAAGLSIL
jgi:hypothetical protein